MEMTLKSIRLDGGQLEAYKQPCDPAALISGVAMRQLELTPERRIEVHIAPDTPASLVTDPLLAEQILTNLVSNAIKYSPTNEPVHIITRTEPERIAIGVHDRGIGISEEEQPRVFSRFFRSKTSRNISGIGLGLNISQRLAILLGGLLSFQSRQGVGSTFTLHLPLKE
ncbi:sensor histidine kinase [Roseibium salinum]|uniref:histidine kinase n=2 Tax=Roseibium salinum TaxID=1604349 RepID=A0ABT3R1F4_9HYPH|nr:ATP-binding protein [Roseibium sp. DSM 29163]MCX2723045.1 ATP-binding protein [Roseibium sp. DSM 29163]MDN3719016.1 ATP-binding protein [Roseibium salinum]